MRKLNLKLMNFVMLTLAGIINAVGVTLFLAPVKLFDSGISGTAFLLDMITPPYLIMSMFLIILNVPFYILGGKKLGWDFIIYSLYAIGIYSLAALLFRNVLPIDFSGGSPFTGEDKLLSAIFGGLLSGIGSGTVIRFGGAIDGVEVMAVLFSKKIGCSVGTFVMAYNILLYTVSAFIFHSWLIPLYSIITYAVGIKAVDFVVEGLDKAKAVMIITRADSELPMLLTETLGRGATVYKAGGVYSGEEKLVIYVVVNRFEIGKVKKIVETADSDAFASVTDVSETVGGISTGFKKV
ncbi:YitT family protein [uncultured Ruminococcus sp.]|uniref:YitT family protein n=1 Tax=uncultured Ruminococcus sp. TaxID=165186 RepID=UPI0025E9CC77|nr:YitT family protein [uncultured Ruminococcus sp.]